MNPLRLLAAFLRPPAAPRPSGRAARPMLSLSALEDRIVPAVGALGLVEGNFLTVVGDDPANTIVLRETNGQLTIDGGRFATSSGPANSIAASSISGFIVVAGAGDDTVLIDPSVTMPGVIEGGDGNDALVAGSGDTELLGGAGDDKLFGGRGDDRLYGEAGNDTLVGGAGRDVAFGGTGADLFARSTEVAADRMAAATMIADPARPQLPAPAAPAAAPALGAFRVPTTETATLVGDVLKIQGTNAADAIKLTLANGSYALADGTPIGTDSGSAASVSAARVRAVVVLGYGGDDVIDLSAARVPTRVVAGAGNDTVTGGRAGDVIFAGSGNDVINSGAGNDTVYGGSGNDAINLGAGDDVVYLGSGASTVSGGSGRDRVVGADAADAIGADVEFNGVAVEVPNPRRAAGVIGRPGR